MKGGIKTKSSLYNVRSNREHSHKSSTLQSTDTRLAPLGFISPSKAAGFYLLSMTVINKIFSFGITKKAATIRKTASIVK